MHMKGPRIVVFVVAACLCVLAMPAVAAAQDTVVMVNGDRLTGEVKELRRGQLKFDPDFAASFMLDWAKVASIATSGAFDLVTETGETYVGRLQTRFAGQVDVLDFNGVSVVTLALIEVVSLAPIRTSFIKNLDGSVSLGGSYTQSSGIAQMSFDGSVVYRQPSFEASAQASASFTQDPDSDDTSRYSLQLGYTRIRPSGWMVAPFGLFESNRELGYDFRSTGALAIGRYLIRTNRARLMLGGGASVNRESPVDGEKTTNVDALFVFNTSFVNFDFPETDIEFGLLVFPGLTDWGRVRLNADLRFIREIINNFSITLTVYNQYDNKPPTASASQNDVGVSLSFGWTF